MGKDSLDAFIRTVTVQWPETTRANAKDLLIRTAQDGNDQILADQSGRAGMAPSVTAYANRPGNTNLDSVVLPGPIVYQYDYRKEIVSVTLEALIASSPKRSGNYAASHTIYLNGSAIDELPEQLSPSDEIMISNPVPYARRLEIGKTKAGRSFVIQVDPRIYETVAKQVIHPLYYEVAKIKFTYATLPGAYVTKGGLGESYKVFDPKRGLIDRKRNPINRTPGQVVQAPAILINSWAA